MEILAANDQENLVHNLQAGAAGKSLNAGSKGFNAKTPGNKAPKTPFKVPLNDENAVFRAGKSVFKPNGKGTENLLMTTKKGGKSDDNAFVTPAGPRNRAPLGMKTTNAKTRAFQTPAPLSASAKTQKLSPRLRRPKVKVLQQDAQDEEGNDVPEVEYMPPKEIPLPDNLDDDMDPINWDFPMFKGENAVRGIHSAYYNPLEDDGRTKGERELEESLAREQKEANDKFDKLFADIMAKDEEEAMRGLGMAPPKKLAPKEELPRRKMPAPSTLKARSAVAALSPPPKPNYAAPTAAAKTRVPSSLIPSRKPAKPTMNPSTSRNAAASAASRTTIGYAQGRLRGATARKPLSNVTQPPPSSASSRRPTTATSLANRNASSRSVVAKPRGAFSRSSSTATDATLVAPSEENNRTVEDVEREFELLLLQDDDDENVDAWMDSFRSQVEGDPIDEQFEDFQFQLPEGF